MLLLYLTELQTQFNSGKVPGARVSTIGLVGSCETCFVKPYLF